MALLVVGGLLYQLGYLCLNYPDADRFPVRGIDVSHHQDTIIWDSVRRDCITFAYIKASEGTTWRDPLFLQNWHNAGQAGIVRGAYHFFSFCSSSGRLQAENFVTAISEATAASELPPAVDVEYVGNCPAPQGTDQIRNELRIFLEHLERSCGRRPIIYVTSESYEQIVRGHFQGYSLWIRDVVAEPQVDVGPWVFWQYADNLRTPGVGTLTDGDLFNGSLGEFEDLISTTGSTAH